MWAVKQGPLLNLYTEKSVSDTLQRHTPKNVTIDTLFHMVCISQHFWCVKHVVIEIL